MSKLLGDQASSVAADFRWHDLGLVAQLPFR
jgi:hypothetical protein